MIAQKIFFRNSSLIGSFSAYKKLKSNGILFTYFLFSPFGFYVIPCLQGIGTDKPPQFPAEKADDMFTIDELLSKRNQRDALAHFRQKKNGCGPDGMPVSDLEKHWRVNGESIMNEIRACSYEPGFVKNVETVNGKGKRRMISSLNVIDRFISRLLSQKLRRYLEPGFLPHSYAYQQDKGVVQAVEYARETAAAGNTILVEVDVQDFFDTISLELLLQKLETLIPDTAVLALIKKYLYCKVLEDGQIKDKTIGLIQGNSISPVLSNLYLDGADHFMEESGFLWMRFADNLYLFSKEKETAEQMYTAVCDYLKNECRLAVNERKSGIYDIFGRRILGYEFYRWKGRMEARKHKYKPTNKFYQWHPSALQRVDRTYHLIQNGVLNKKDFSLIFENEEEKHNIPVEVVQQMNVYHDITISSAALRQLNDKNIKLMIFDKYGNRMCSFVSETHTQSGMTLLKQCALYLDDKRRLRMARAFELAGLHNMISNLRYYNKQKKGALTEDIKGLTELKRVMNEAPDIGTLMLTEARARQLYYASFNKFLKQEEFAFTVRTKRPPKDEINAMISFGNTLLYNLCLHMLSKTSLDPRVGVIHSTNQRANTLDLDFADLFKPIIVDRLIFSLINMLQVKAQEHFREDENGGVYMNPEGKRIFVQAYEEKLNSMLTDEGKNISYRQLIEKEIYAFQKSLDSGEPYHPYKYR